LKDGATLNAYLKQDVLDQFRDDTEQALFINPNGEVFAGASRGPTAMTPAAFAAGAEPFIQAAFRGEEHATGALINGRAYHIITVTVSPGDSGLIGVLVFGIRISDATLQRIKPPQTEILLVAGRQVVASSLEEAGQTDAVLRQIVAAPVADMAAGDTGRIQWVTVAGDRYLPLAGVLEGTAPAQDLHYVLLANCEPRLQVLADTWRTLLGLSAIGILVSGGAVWFFIRRVTRPLIELRNSAEAVGRGDFSRRIERFSNDECGELAVAFNQMTSNLQTSRAELEHAMQTVKATQEQLIQSEKLSAVGQFVAGVAHELNNPLTAVIGFSELLQSMDTDEKTRGHLDRIAKSAHRCHKIVHSLLSFARQEAPERKLVALHTIVDEVLEIMAYDLRTSNVTVVREFAPSLPPIMADPHQLQQVFVNILGNARQAIEPFQREGRIVVRTQVQDGWVTIEFQDNGPGIKPEHVARIFDPFFTTKPAGKGTGLGLSLSYGLIQEHGGRIKARSELGHGAAFIIELPVAANVAPSPLRRSGTPFPFAAGTGPSGKSVLVIDDEEWILDLAGELLRSEGHTVEVAANGQRALELLARQKFDVIVSDWKMPGLNGIRLYEHLLATNPEAAKRMFFMTGDVVSDTFQAFLQQHELACLSKPFAISEFRAAVNRMFKQAT
jgi:signal transduction histidine kinase/ActR/RegA family two-component response regulator